MIGNLVLNYKITSELGSGGMAVVYEGIHQHLDTKAAIKILNKNLSEKPEIARRFKNEAKLLNKLNSHPNIVNFLNYDEGEHGLVLIMDFISGISLDQFINKEIRFRKPSIGIPFFLKILQAFQFAHNQGIVHRDIKPSNIMVSRDFEPLILDFGIAKAIGNEFQSETKTSSVMGSRPYMSPEQVISIKGVDNRSDIYSLGVTFFQILTGKNPYDSSMSDYEIMDKIIKSPLPKINDPKLNEIIQKATHKKAEKRFQTCDEFIGSLENYLQGKKENISPTPPEEIHLMLERLY